MCIEDLTCAIGTGICISSCSHNAPAPSRTLKLLIGWSKMASNPSQLQFIPIAQDWPDWNISWKKAAFVKGMFETVADHWVKSCFFTSPTLLRVHVLLYMTMNLSSSVTPCGSTHSGCEERVVNTSLTVGQAINADQADFFPFLDIVWSPLIAWSIIIGFNFSGCRLFVITHTGM